MLLTPRFQSAHLSWMFDQTSRQADFYSDQTPAQWERSPQNLVVKNMQREIRNPKMVERFRLRIYIKLPRKLHQLPLESTVGVLKVYLQQRFWECSPRSLGLKPPTRSLTLPRISMAQWKMDKNKQKQNQFISATQKQVHPQLSHQQSAYTIVTIFWRCVGWAEGRDVPSLSPLFRCFGRNARF